MVEKSSNSNKASYGGLKRVQLYGNPGTKEGRSKGGKKTTQYFQQNPEIAKYSGFVIRKVIGYPKRCSKLAEFIGILLGDGGVRSKHQLFITVNFITDFQYARNICSYIKELFSLDGRIRKRKDSNGADIIVCSSNLIDFLLKQGIVSGNKVKNQVDVPDWIKDKLEFQKACLRGLIDTDGGVYLHRYKSGSKQYEYLKLCFTNCSKPLLDFVLKVLTELDIKASLQGYHVSVFSKAGVKKYFKLVGSSNPKHLNRFRAYFGEVPEWPNGAAC